jgi:hypothetical protein
VKLTCICPGIRTANWKKLYDSMFKACKKHEWEMVFVGPYDLPPELEGKHNIVYIKDWASPIICQQKGLLASTGEYITWAADDGYFLENSLDVGFSLIAEQGSRGAENNYKIVVMGKYTEGDGNTEHMKGNDYYVLTNHESSTFREIPKGTYMLNVGLVSRKLLLEVGGWDCQFEVCPMAYNDLAIRLQKFGCPFVIQNELMFSCSHLPGHMGDHGPIHDGQVLHDQPLFEKIWNPRSTPPKTRIHIPVDTFKDMPTRWERRFGAA